MSLVEAVVTLPAPVGLAAALTWGEIIKSEQHRVKTKAILIIFFKKFTSYERLSFVTGSNNDCVNLTTPGVKFHCIKFGNGKFLTRKMSCDTIKIK